LESRNETPLWTPRESRASQATRHRYSFRQSSHAGKPLIGGDDFHELSIDDPAMFCSALGAFTKISGAEGCRPSRQLHEDAGRSRHN
jgi:hypothetical protein